MAAGLRSLLAPWMGGAAAGMAPATQAGVKSLLGFWAGGAASPDGVAPEQAGFTSLLGFWAGGAAVGDVIVTPPTPSEAAGHGTRRIAIEARGRILYFESEDEAREWIEAQAPKQAKAIRKLARRAVQGGVNLLAVFEAPHLVSGPPQLRALVEMRAAVLKAKFTDETARLAKERAQQDEEDEEMAANFMMLLH